MQRPRRHQRLPRKTETLTAGRDDARSGSGVHTAPHAVVYLAVRYVVGIGHITGAVIAEAVFGSTGFVRPMAVNTPGTTRVRQA